MKTKSTDSMAKLLRDALDKINSANTEYYLSADFSCHYFDVNGGVFMVNMGGNNFIAAETKQELIDAVDADDPHSVSCAYGTRNDELTKKHGEESVFWLTYGRFSIPQEWEYDDYVGVPELRPSCEINEIRKFDNNNYLVQYSSEQGGEMIGGQIEVFRSLTAIAKEFYIPYNQREFDRLLKELKPAPAEPTSAQDHDPHP